MKTMNKGVIRVAAALFLLFSIASCRTSKQIGETATISKSTKDIIENVVQNQSQASHITAKMNIAIQADGKNISAGGNLRMKHNDVIQLSIVVMGLVEAARVEFTPDSVLIIDRINRQYVKESYDAISFLKAADIDFYAMQALFWNQLFAPGSHNTLPENKFKSTVTGQNAVLELEEIGRAHV